MEPFLTIFLFTIVTIGINKWIIKNTGIKNADLCPPYDEPPNYEEIIES